jgi:hypothetical protein
VHDPQEPESIRHSKVADASPVKERLAEVELTNPDGPESIVGAEGATVSTVQVLLAAVEAFPA